MKISKSKQQELEVWKYFIPKNCDWLSETEKDIQMFFEWSEQGKHRDVVTIPTYLKEGRTYFHALVWGKKRAGIHIHEMWEPGILEGNITYYELLGGNTDMIRRKWFQIWKPKITFSNVPIPISVLNFMKKEMFKGMDANILQKCYESI